MCVFVATSLKILQKVQVYIKLYILTLITNTSEFYDLVICKICIIMYSPSHNHLTRLEIDW